MRLKRFVISEKNYQPHQCPECGIEWIGLPLNTECYVVCRNCIIFNTLYTYEEIYGFTKAKRMIQGTEHISKRQYKKWKKWRSV